MINESWGCCIVFVKTCFSMEPCKLAGLNMTEYELIKLLNIIFSMAGLPRVCTDYESSYKLVDTASFTRI